MQSGSLYWLVTWGRHIRLAGSIGFEFSFSLRLFDSSISSGVAAVAANEYVVASSTCRRDNGSVYSLEGYVKISSLVELPISVHPDGVSYTCSPGVPRASHACLERVAVSVSGVPSWGITESRSSGG